MNHQNLQRIAKGRSSRVILLCTMVLAIATLSAPTAQAQFRASIQGTVVDPTGAVIPGVTLTLTDTDTNHVITATSNGSGVYNFNALPSDHFTLTAEAKGFQTNTIQDVHIIPEQSNALDVTMQPGDTSTTITVNGSQTSPLETETASSSGTVDSNQIQHLPSAGRDVFQLAQLAPGVFGDGAQGSGGGTKKLPGTRPWRYGQQCGNIPDRKWPPGRGKRWSYATNGIRSTVSALPAQYGVELP